MMFSLTVRPGKSAGLRHMGDAEPDDRFRSEARDRAAVEEDVAGGGLRQTGNRAQRRRFAGAIGAEQGDDLARLDGERDAVHSLDLAVADDRSSDLKQRHRIRLPR